MSTARGMRWWAASVGLVVLGAAVWLAGGLVAAVIGAAGAVAVAVTLVRPGLPGGPTAVAAAVVGELAAADQLAWWRCWIAALLLAGYLVGSEVAQSGAGRAGASAWRVHSWPLAVAVAGSCAVAGVSAWSPHSAVAAMLLGGLAAAAAVAILAASAAARPSEAE